MKYNTLSDMPNQFEMIQSMQKIDPPGMSASFNAVAQNGVLVRVAKAYEIKMQHWQVTPMASR